MKYYDIFNILAEDWSAHYDDWNAYVAETGVVIVNLVTWTSTA